MKDIELNHGATNERKNAARTVLLCSIRVIRLIRGFQNEQSRISRLTRMKEGTMDVIDEAESSAITGAFLFQRKDAKVQRTAKK